MELSIQLANVFSNGFESRIVENKNISTQLLSALNSPPSGAIYNEFESRYIVDCVKLSTLLANAVLNRFLSRYIMECVKLSTQMAKASLNGFESRVAIKHLVPHGSNIIFYNKRIMLDLIC